MSAGVTQVWTAIKQKGNFVWEVALSWTDGATPGTVPATALKDASFASVAGSYLFAFKTIPSASAAPSVYSFTLVDSDGLDILNGAGASRPATGVQVTIPQQDSSNALFGPVFCDAGVTLNVTGNSNANGAGVIKLFFSVNDIP